MEPLRRWPPASALPQLIRRSAGFVAEGCQASSLRIGGRAYVRVLVPAAGPASAGCPPRPAAPPLATLVLRAPSAGLAMQYEATAPLTPTLPLALDLALALTLTLTLTVTLTPTEAAVLRAMRSLRAWADAGEVTAEQRGDAGVVTAEQTRALLSLPGGGAAEMQLAALCRAAATDADAAANKATGEHGAAGVMTSERGAAVALRALAAALHALPRQVHLG